MSKDVLLTTCYLLGFTEATTGDATPLDVAKLAESDRDVTVELKVGNRFEVNAIIGESGGKVNVPIWVLDYKLIDDSEVTGEDLWQMSIALDETYRTYESAQQALVETVDYLMSELESPTSLSNLKLADVLTN